MYLRFALPCLGLIAFTCLPLTADAADIPVSIAASDDPELKAPIGRDQPLTTDQVLDMTRHAVDRIGGMAAYVPDTARVVAIKPNISIPRASGTGIISDARVVRAVALLVHEVAPSARILIAEGAGGWISPALADCSLVALPPGTARSQILNDGFEIAGHRATVAELRGMGIDIDVHDLNFDLAPKVSVPGGGLLWDEYEIASTILDADVWINVPVAKTHGAKITCCMKNHFGVLPGTVYGWNKARGTETHSPMPHFPRTMDEAWIDLVLLTRVDLNIVDMIVGTEGGAFEGTPRRSNLIVAGPDPIATDLVVAQLMGFNPDDFEFADLGAQRGIGPGSIDHVDVRGGDPMALRQRFIKASADYDGDWREHAQYGMGPRRWILQGPLPKDHNFTERQLTDLSPVPGVDGWSDVIWFGDDKTDLDTYYDDPVQCVVYAFTHFTMTHSDSVRFWVGSDEGVTVWIDGVQVHRHQGRRRHELGNERIPGYVAAGEHSVLVRAEQGRGRFDFSFNVCEPIDDNRFAGNRYPGVRYYQANAPSPGGEQKVKARQAWDPWKMGDVQKTFEPAEDPLVTWQTAPDSLLLPMPDRSAHTTALLDVIASQVPQITVWAQDDTAMPWVASHLPFTMHHMGIHKEWWAPPQGVALSRVLGWAGLSHWLSTANGAEEAGKTLAGWLAQGKIPMTGYEEGWEQVLGYVKTDRTARVFSVAPDTAFWEQIGDGRWGAMPGTDWVEMPVLVVEPTGVSLTYDAWVDSLAAVALELARRPRIDYEEQWGKRGCPAGLAGWDAFVIEWERLPWTAAWVRSGDGGDLLGQMQRGYYEWSARGRRLAGETFATAASHATGSRGQLLKTAAAAYAEVGSCFQTIYDALPERDADAVSAADSLREIEQMRPLARRARDAERQALEALRQLLGAEPLPPAREDPLLRRNRGRIVATWQASLSKGVYDLVLADGQLTRTLVYGKDVEDEVSHVIAPLSRKKGWQVAIEAIQGDGLYQVWQQPSQENGWVTRVRVDDEWTERGNSAELRIWEVPAAAQTR